MIPFLENKKSFLVSKNDLCLQKMCLVHITKIPFHVFDRYEIHIQAFVHFMNGKIIIFNPHLHKSISRICIHNSTKQVTHFEEIEELWYLGLHFLEHFRFF